MQISSFSPRDVSTQIAALAQQLEVGLPGFAVASTALRSADTTGADWREQFREATHQASEAWKAPYAAIKAAQAGAAALGDSPAATAARDAIAGMAKINNRGFESIGRGYTQFWANPDPYLAGLTLGGVANVSDRSGAAVAVAVVRLREIALSD